MPQLKHFIPKVIVCSLFATLLLSACSTHDLNELSWLTGDWERDFNNTSQMESWKLRNDTIYGEVKYSNGNDTSVMWLSKIYNKDGLTLELINDKNIEPYFFTIKKKSDTSIIFHNPEYQFPKEILYRTSGDSLVKIIHGSGGKIPKSAAFKFGRLSN
ncbi:hypothetical protein [Salibacter halophilus]|uniref:Lipoprotein n=1 Tax=Salibacter halophilus TaxID=1803916 RepID=A0A6N6M4M0_9FLAO|nr:hypothetical protein [Salibacter halophilus]KAB1064315.1 hypothetical protein F3059_06330 [Salibacter halophilus]